MPQDGWQAGQIGRIQLFELRQRGRRRPIGVGAPSRADTIGTAAGQAALWSARPAEQARAV